MQIIHHIGEWYKYPNSSEKFKLKSVDGFIYRFECGHCCTDSVFMDMILVKTGKKVCVTIQLELEL